MINCRTATELHTDAEAGVLVGTTKTLYALHMKVCGPCKRYRAQLAAMSAALKELPDQAPPPSLVDLLAAELPKHS